MLEINSLFITPPRLKRLSGAMIEQPARVHKPRVHTIGYKKANAEHISVRSQRVVVCGLEVTGGR
jgi:hypothetical protein